MQRTALRLSAFLAAGLGYCFLVTWMGQVSGAYFDSIQYLGYAKNLLDQGIYGAETGLPDMNREPGYGFYLAGLMALFGREVFHLKMAQAFVLFLACGFCAFAGGLPARIRKPLFLLGILSPTCIGAMREIYSEALAIPLSFVLLGLASRALRGGQLAIVGAGIVFGLAVLTKSYFYYASFAFLLTGAALAAIRGRVPGWKAPAALCAALAICGISAQQAWNTRNHRLFGENVSDARLSIALVGKVARLHEARWGSDLPVSLAASLGTNFCDKLFGPERCGRFDYRGCDAIGNDYLNRYRAELQAGSLVDRALKRDMLKLYLARPITQLFGSGLELLRMFFFEAVLDAGTFPALLQAPARAWHILGSLLFWCFILMSFTRHRRHWARLPAADRCLALGCLLLAAYHALTMVQITNVVRYVFPILPFLYYFTADGIALILERKQSWTIGPKPQRPS